MKINILYNVFYYTLKNWYYFWWNWKFKFVKNIIFYNIYLQKFTSIFLKTPERYTWFHIFTNYCRNKCLSKSYHEITHNSKNVGIFPLFLESVKNYLWMRICLIQTTNLTHVLAPQNIIFPTVAWIASFLELYRGQQKHFLSFLLKNPDSKTESQYFSQKSIRA